MADVADRVGLVLAGGGARGAYEMGALSVLLPELEKRGERPRVIVGTSVGALNASFIAATAHEPVADVVSSGQAIWGEIRFDQVLRPVRSPALFKRMAEYVGQFLRVPKARLDALLDPSPLKRTLERHVPTSAIAANVADGHLHAAAVAATSAATSRSVVFHCGGAPPLHDERRAIDYAATQRLNGEHVRASAAIPGLFPAVNVSAPQEARGWYFDGGTRLNTPIKPALALGADRVVVIALNAIEEHPAQLASEQRPDVFQGAYQLIDGLLAAPLAHDMATLTSVNELLTQATPTTAQEHAPPARKRKRRIPYIFIAPSEPLEIGRLAFEVFNRHYRHLLKALLRSELAFLGRAVAAGTDPLHGELLSYLFFAPEFGQSLMERGEEDARDWLASHEHDLWETGPVHVARSQRGRRTARPSGAPAGGQRRAD